MLNWCTETQVSFMKDFVQYMSDIGFTSFEIRCVILSDASLMSMIQQINTACVT